MERTAIFLAVGLLVAQIAFAGGTKEQASGREAAVQMVEKGAYVAPSYLDLENILDDYEFTYEVAEGASLSGYADLDHDLIPEWGGEKILQLSIVSAAKEHFPETSFNYVVFPYSDELFKNGDLRGGLKEALTELVWRKTGDQKVWFYLRKDRAMVGLESASDVESLLRRAEAQLEIETVPDAVRRFAEAEKDLQALLTAAEKLPGNRPNKFFLILDKPIADSARDLGDVSAIIAGFGNPQTEISFCGHGESFRAQTVNIFVDQFGGNSYYVNDGQELREVVKRDFDYYSRPAITDLSVMVYALGAVPDKKPVRVCHLVSMGPGDHHIFFATLSVPSRSDYVKATLAPLTTYSREDVEKANTAGRVYPLACVAITYFDAGLRKYVHDSRVVTARYTDDYTAFLDSENPRVARNLVILDTYRLFGTAAAQLTRGDSVGPLVEINSQMKRLERLKAEDSDKLIGEDIELLNKYKLIIRENRGNPFAAIKRWAEIKRRRY